MASIKLRIEVNPNGETEFGKNDGVEKIGNIVNDNAELSNVSYKTEVKNNQNVFNITTINENGRNALSWANNDELQFDDDDYLSLDGFEESEIEDEQNPDMFVWGAVPQNKQYSVKLTFSNASSLKDIVVYGDKTANQFPTKAIIDGKKTIYSDDYQWAINMEEESETHTIEFLEWNRANYNACLTRIMVMLRYFDLDKGWIDSVESLTQSTSDASSLNYGILANSGSATVSDLNGEIQDYVQDGIMPSSNLDVKLLVNGSQIQEHIISDSDYDITKKEFSASMTNKLTDLGVLKYNGFIYQGEPISLYDLLSDIMSNLTTQSIDSMMSSNIKSTLQKITVEYPSIEYGKTYEEILNEICTLAQLNMICDEDNNYKFYSARPIFHYDEKIIQIPDSSLVETPNYDLILKNKYEGVSISEVEIRNLVNYDTVVYPANIDLTNKSVSDMIKNTSTNQNIIERSQFISAATFYYEIVSYIKSDYYIYSDSITIPKKTSNNLSQIIRLNETLLRTNEFAYTVTYDKYKGSVTASSIWDRGDNEITVSNITYGTTTYNERISENGVVEDISSYTTTLPDGTSTTSSTSTFPKQPEISITEDDNNYYITYSIVVGKNITKLGGNNRWTATSTSSINIDLSGEYEEYKPLKLEFSIYGDKREISFDTVISASSPNIENCKTKATVSTSGNLLQTGTKYDNVKLSDYIKQNILSDYANGISTGSVNLFPINLYYSDETFAKNWGNGEILNVGELIAFNDIDKVWRVTGKKFTYDGEPLINVEYQEAVGQGYFKFEYDSGSDSYKLIGISANCIYKKITIPSTYDDGINGEHSVTAIGDYAIKQGSQDGMIPTKLTTITIPSTVTSIGNYALAGSKITSIIIPNSIISIGEYALSECTNLTSVTFEGGIFGEIPSGLFNACTSLETIVNTQSYTMCCLGSETYTPPNQLPSGLTEIGSYAFHNCSSLTTITIPKSITKVGNYAFVNSGLTDVYYCGLTSERIDNLEISPVNSPLFNANWHYIEDVLYEYVDERVYGEEGYRLKYITPEFTGASLTIPNTYNDATHGELNVIAVGTYAISQGSSSGTVITSITTITLPNTVKYIENSAFANSKVMTIVLGSGLIKYGEQVFKGNTSLTSIYYNGSMDDWFNIEFGNQLDEQGVLTYSATFYVADRGEVGGASTSTAYYGKYYYKIMTFNMTSSQIVVGDYQFLGWSQLTSVNLSTATSLGMYAFYECSALKKITMGNELTIIDTSAFGACSLLSDVYYGGSEDDRAKIIINSGNDYLTNATWHYNS